ncbi:MAG: 23S rRNA (uracil1939-C5)-methyltransferase [Candidatus Marinamargulisbacteria bacterium]|jgi:23S rRNA (uracil1939-C5)-methyltransferase
MPKPLFQSEIQKLHYTGAGQAMVNNKLTLVPGTIPGDEVQIDIFKRQKDNNIGRCVSFIKKSKDRTAHICDHFPTCGGCQLIDLPYDKQIEIKTQVLNKAVKVLYPSLGPKVLPMIPSYDSIHYRNKMDFAFAQDETGIYLGLKKRGAFAEVVRLKKCFLQSELSNRIRQHTADFFSEYGLSTWDYTTQAGILRHLVIREAKTTNQVLLNLIVSVEHPGIVKKFSDSLTTLFPEITAVYVTINPNKGDAMISTELKLLAGNPHIFETFHDLQFRVSPLSFFQTNSHQAVILYDKIAEMANLSSSDTVLDLYCGTGTIGLSMAKRVNQVIGIEENPSATSDAEKNAAANKIENITFITGRVKNILKFNSFSPDLVIVDPPRNGMAPKALRRMTELAAKKLIYVSCNPLTLFNDLKLICEAGYSVKEIQPVDMFPNTFHMETIVRLDLEA